MIIVATTATIYQAPHMEEATHSFPTCVLSIYYTQGSAVGAGDVAGNK